ALARRLNLSGPLRRRAPGSMKTLTFIAALAAPAIAAAEPMSPDPTGLWWVPRDSRSGLWLVQQQETVVAVIFVYDDAQRPIWYVATTRDTGQRFDPNV